MLKKIKNILYTIKKNEIVSNKTLLEEKYSQGYTILSSNIKFEKIYIPHSSYSLNPDVIVDVLNDIILNKRKSIFEFGTGILTLYIAKLIKINDLDVIFVSIESDSKWKNLIGSLLDQEGLADYVTLKHVDIVDVNKYNYLNQNKWYNFKDVVDEVKKNTLKLDLVIVDAPFGQTCNYARYSAIPVLKDFLDDEYSIYLDDTNRAVEREIFSEWEKILNVKGNNFGTYSKINKGTHFKTHILFWLQF